MRELCANTIYKFVNRFSFGAQESLTLDVEKPSFCSLFFFFINQLQRKHTLSAVCDPARSDSQHKINN